jgi:Flp pilus assembly CpaF family ATPase
MRRIIRGTPGGGGPMLRTDRSTAPPDGADMKGNQIVELAELFSEEVNPAQTRMFELLNDPDVSQISVNRFDRLFYVDSRGTQFIGDMFPSPAAYRAWLDDLLLLTDVGYESVEGAQTSVIEGSFNPERTSLHGSIHVATTEITRGDPALTIRKQPHQIITLDTMLGQGMMSEEMRRFLEIGVRGRANFLISGGSGAGKTTLARALSWYIDPTQRIITVEEIDELHLADRLPNVVSLTTYKKVGPQGETIRRIELEDLVREALRMRADRIWVGETRGKESYSLVRACNSGHDGSCTTIHADNGTQAVKQLVTYVMESGMTEEVAREQVAQAFHLVVQIARVKLGRRVITEITELEPVREGNEQRRNTIFVYDHHTGGFRQTGQPSPRLLQDWARYGVNYDTGWRVS